MMYLFILNLEDLRVYTYIIGRHCHDSKQIMESNCAARIYRKNTVHTAKREALPISSNRKVGILGVR